MSTYRIIRRNVEDFLHYTTVEVVHVHVAVVAAQPSYYPMGNPDERFTRGVFDGFQVVASTGCDVVPQLTCVVHKGRGQGRK